METDVYGRASGDSAQTFHEPALQTRCPSCRKLFAIDALPIDSAERPLYQCPVCDVAFTVLTSPEGESVASELIVSEPEGRAAFVESVRVEDARASGASAPSSGDGADPGGGLDEAVGRGRKQGRKQEQRQAALAVPLAEQPFKGTPKAPPAAAEKTGSESFPDEEIFVAELALGAKPELILLWKRIIDDYEDGSKHEAFLSACLKTGALAYAAHKYGRILQQFPDEEIARRMRKRLVALASSPAEPVGDLAKPVMGVRMPGLNSMAIALGTATAVMGLSFPDMQNMTGVGAAMVALALGLRFFANRSGA